MQHLAQDFEVRLAESEADVRAAQRLRYDVFVKELGGGGPMVDHDARLERDVFDPFLDHLLLTDRTHGEVVGVYRMARPEMAKRAGGYYSASEYDLSMLERSGRRLLELGRSCLHPAYRGGPAMHHLWRGLAKYVTEHKIEVLFGVASFHGTDIKSLAAPLSLLYQRHLAPADMRVRAREEAYQDMNLIAADKLDRRASMVQVPGLIKAYLRLGGYVGDGAFVDTAFNTTDVCLIMDAEALVMRHARAFLEPAA